MQNDALLSRVKEFPPLMWILLFGAFITRGSFYMVWPFLSIILYQKFALSATDIGLILSFAAIVAVFVGFIASTLSDKFGRQNMMYTSGILYIVSFSLLAQADSVTSYLVVITMCSIATEMWRPITSALVGDIIKDRQLRELAMQARYFMVNVGAAIGPMLGIWLGLTGEQSSFYITAGAFALLLIILAWGFRNQQLVNYKNNETNQVSENTASESSFLDIIKILVQDRLLQCLILANILCMFVYGQMDTSLIQYLTRAEVPQLLELISSMIFTNSVIIITSQFLLLKLMSSLSLIARIQIGLVLLMTSQIWMAFNPVGFYWGWIGAVVIMSFAEAILFPSMNIHIDRIAPDHLRGAYFGATSFYSLGFAFAPLGGGLLLDHLGGSQLFIISASLCFVVIYLYSILDRLPRDKGTIIES